MFRHAAVRLNTLDHTAWWLSEAAQWLNGYGLGLMLGLGLGNVVLLFFSLVLQNVINIFVLVTSYVDDITFSNRVNLVYPITTVHATVDCIPEHYRQN